VAYSVVVIQPARVGRGWHLWWRHPSVENDWEVTTPGARLGFCVQLRTPGWGGGESEERPTVCVDHEDPGNEGAERGQLLRSDFEGEEDVQQMAFIILMIITVLPSTARKRPSR